MELGKKDINFFIFYQKQEESMAGNSGNWSVKGSNKESQVLGEIAIHDCRSDQFEDKLKRMVLPLKPDTSHEYASKIKLQGNFYKIINRSRGGN